MAVIKLEPGETTTLPPGGTLSLSWQVRGMQLGAVSLRFERTDAPGQPSPAAQPTGPGSWLVPALPLAATVVVSPVGGGTFPDGVHIDLQLSLRLQSGSDEYVFPSVDVSGTSQSRLLELTPLTSGWQLSVKGSAAPPTTPTVPVISATAGVPVEPSPDLPPLSQSAIYRCRELIGGEGALPPEHRSELHIAVDRSASMLPFVRAGARRALLEVLTGVNAVAGTSPEVPVWQLGVVPAVAPKALSSTSVHQYDDLLGSVPRTTGTVLAPLVQATSSATRRTVVVLTDSAPADVDDLRFVLDQARSNGNQTRWHLLALARSTSDPAVQQEAWRDELGALRPLLSQVLTTSSVSPGDGDGWLATRLAERSAIAEVVAGLGLVGAPR